jgi:hypothetical protein
MSAVASPHPRPSRIAPATFALVGTALIALLALAYVSGRDVRVIADRAEAIVIDAENAAFCAGLDLAPQIEVHVRGMTGLAKIRHRQDERRNEDAIGLL